ncbi:beta-N-acetylhexosaminidase [Ureibacillus manganicus]|uniref:Beta-N-acetylhexosaminidase n=1 Tax=Ureibacillus manganicus DSM 26584 TaxID=1384049 RepID=A0A0A3I2J4_9BACL|nr:beta-N-acetylhexosaminidase [Ureibacillus manganicus]KGR77720.1 beta-N-acetylhexosaminidase [Ureibacillus manganicus DSM 26584]
MSLKKKVGRLLIAGFKGIIMSDEIKFLIHEYHISGIILFGRNIGTPKEILDLTQSLQREAKAAGYSSPLLICIDQENGVVRRLGEGTTIIPGAMLLGATDNPQHAYAAGVITGKELKALGINWNLAPVVDVNNNPKNPVIGVRSFGEDQYKVAEFAKQSMLGMQKAKVMTTLKHFPGHGDTSVDSHLDLPIINHDLQRLHEVELVPFKECIAAGADAIMTAHVYFPALETEENTPATLSRSVITNLLREELKFAGVITTDCMEMDAIAKGIGTVNGAVKAIQAGVDLVMVSHIHSLQEQSILKIVEAVENGEISEKQIDESISRIENMINNYTNWTEIEVTKLVPPYVGSGEHKNAMREIYLDGVTVVQDNGKAIQKDEKVLLIYPTNQYAMMVEDKRYSTIEMADQLKKVHSFVDVMEINPSSYDEEITTIANVVQSYDHIVVLTLSAIQQTVQEQFVNEIIKTGKLVDVVAIRSPYDVSLFTLANRLICTYEFTKPAFEVVSQYLVGNVQLNGKLPVTTS